MKNPRIIFRRAYNRLSPLLLLFQRSPFVQMLLPEAKIIGFAGGGEAAKWTIATVAGLGAYDSVSGASEIAQTFPQAGSTTVNTAVGANLTFIFQCVGTIGEPGSWSVEPDPSVLGLTVGSVPNENNRYRMITGVPTQEGEYQIRVTAWKGPLQNDLSIFQDFTINIGPAIITQHPQPQTISSGGTATLNVGVSSGSGTTYQWFRGPTPIAGNLITNATQANYTTPALTTTSSYLVRVIRNGIVSFSNVATVTVSSNNTFADWRSAQFNSTQLADTNISGPTADPDGDGADNTKEYVFGTLPLTKENPPMTMSLSGSDISLTFIAKQATGAGYNGRTRHYAIEASPSLGSSSWSSPSGYSDIIGANQSVTYTTARGSSPMFYRLKVWLTP